MVQMFHAACLGRLAHACGECWCIGAAEHGLQGPVVLVPGSVAIFHWELQRG